MSSLMLNKTNPSIKYEPGMVDGEEYHKYETTVFYAKRKDGVYKGKRLAVASKDKVKSKLVVQMFIDKSWAEKRKGRYYDWYFIV